MKGTIIVMGTPAEEGGGGKVELIKKGAFQNVDVSMMVHPCDADYVYFNALAMQELKVSFYGKAAHAAAFPWAGLNALDAVVSAYTAISNLRQQIRPTDRVHGIITDGGTKPNIIPEKASMVYYLRSKTQKQLEELKVKVMRCFEGSALSSGCRMEHQWEGNPYADVISNDVLGDTFAKHATDLGIKYPSKEVQNGIFIGSTDMGNVSYEVPSIHPMYGIQCGPGELNHTRGFTKNAVSDEAHKATWIQGKSMALTGIDLLCDNEIVKRAKQLFEEQKKERLQ